MGTFGCTLRVFTRRPPQLVTASRTDRVDKKQTTKHTETIPFYGNFNVFPHTVFIITPTDILPLVTHYNVVKIYVAVTDVDSFSSSKRHRY